MRVLRNEDTLARSVTSSRDARRCQRDDTPIPISVFDNGQNTVSVDWTDCANQEALIALGDERAKKRGPKRKFHGWVKLSVASARGSNRTVTHTPLRQTQHNLENRFHVDITWPEGLNGDVRTEHLQELVDASEWEASVVSETYHIYSEAAASAFRARSTFSMISAADFVQTNGRGFSL